MSARIPSDIIVNPSADSDIVRQRLRHALVPFYVSLSLLFSAFVTALFLLIFPPMQPSAVQSSIKFSSEKNADGSLTTTEVKTYVVGEEPVIAVAFIMVAIIVVLVIATLFTRSSLTRRLHDKHPDAFADAAVLDGYLVEGEPTDSELWDAAQNEYAARALNAEHEVYRFATALSAEQKDRAEKLVTDRDGHRVAAASILASGTSTEDAEV